MLILIKTNDGEMVMSSTRADVCVEVSLEMRLPHLTEGIVWDINEKFGVLVGEFYGSVC